MPTGNFVVGHTKKPAYCVKEETRLQGPFEKGLPPQSRGKRTDLLYVKQRLDEGATEAELVADEDAIGTVARYPKLVGMYRMATQKHRNFKTQVLVLYGPPKKGKSAFWNICYPNAYIKPHGTWWDGYDGQETVVIDDFYGWLPYSFMLQLLDRYPLLVEVKGGMRTFNSKRIIITSNKSPHLWYGLDCSYPPLSVDSMLFIDSKKIGLSRLCSRGLQFLSTGKRPCPGRMRRLSNSMSSRLL